MRGLGRTRPPVWAFIDTSIIQSGRQYHTCLAAPKMRLQKQAVAITRSSPRPASSRRWYAAPATTGPASATANASASSSSVSTPAPATASAAASPPPAALPIHREAPFEVLSAALSGSQPCFGARGDEITLLGSPEEFKAKLLAMIKRAKRRILISTLYIGASQTELVSLHRSPCCSAWPGLRERRLRHLSHGSLLLMIANPPR